MRDLYEKHGGDPANQHIYNALINAWASSGSQFAASRAHAILLEMEEKHSSDSFVPRPNIISVNSVLKSFCGSPDGTQQAEVLLAKVESETSYEGLKPDIYSYTIAITAYGRSDLEDKAEKAYGIVERLIESYRGGNERARPNINAFNAALSKLWVCPATLSSFKSRCFVLNDLMPRAFSLPIITIPYLCFCNRCLRFHEWQFRPQAGGFHNRCQNYHPPQRVF
jgi:hypothetical protein